MSALLGKKTWQALLLLAVLEVLCVGAGMGVPIFAILLGFPVGWWLARRTTAASAGGAPTSPESMRTVFVSALVPSIMTFAFMVAIWLPQLTLLWRRDFDVANWGIPLWLYTPMASFIGWMVLMVVVSPALQLLAAVFGAYVALMGGPGRDNASRPAAEAPVAD